MSERIFLFLLRLYPAQFRRTYGDDALELLRDRLQDETGLVRRARLWFDLMVDLGALHIRGYREDGVVIATASAPRSFVPSFESLEGESPAFRCWLWGGVLSAIFCGAVLFGLAYGGRHGFGSSPDSFFSANAVSGNPLTANGSGTTKRAIKTSPTIEFTFEPKHPTEGSKVRLSAVVRSDNFGPTPTGTVSFLYGWNELVQGTLVDGSVSVNATLPRGKKLPLSALYLGDVRYYSVSSLEKSASQNRAP